MGKKVLLGLGIVAAVGMGFVASAITPMLHGANGFAAKWVCSHVHLAGHSLERAGGDLPSNPLLDYLEIEAPDSDRIAVSVFGRFERSAIFREGFGCTLIPPELERGDLIPTPVRSEPVDRAGDPDPSMPWPPVPDAVDVPAVEAAVERAFVEEQPDRPKNTRAVVVLYDGALVAERYADGVDSRTPLLGWSMTKSVLNALYGRAVALAHLDLDATPSFEHWGDDRGAITYDQLLRMSSGLAFQEDYGDLDSDAVQMLFVRADAGHVAAQQQLEAAPDAAWSYSSGTSNILSRALRDALGQAAYWDFPRRELFGPAGMPSALLEPDPSGVFVASSFGWATARDWARFGQLYLDDGVVNGERLLPEGWVGYSVRPTPKAPRGIFGAHFWLNAEVDGGPRWPDLPSDLYLASGFQGQAVVIIPSRRAVVARLGLSQAESSWDLPAFLADVLAALPDGLPSPADVVAGSPSDDSSALTESGVE
ncbi:MAG: serine hydrolase [Acidobacteriota bacterium]